MKLPRPILLALVSAVSVMVLAVLTFTLHRVINRDSILGSVTAAGVEIGGMSEAEALARLGELEADLRTATIPVIVGSETFHLELSEIDYTIDSQAVVAEALTNGRQGGIAGQFGWWLRDIVAAPTEISVPFTYDTGALDAMVSAWEVEGLDDPPFQGAIDVAGDEVTYLYPEPGTGIDREGAMVLISASIGDPEFPPVELPTRLLEPRVTAAEVDRAVETTRQLLDGNVSLTDDLGREIVVPADVLGDALVVTIDDLAMPPEFEFHVDGTPLAAYFAGFDEYLTNEPSDAEIVIDTETDEVHIVPSVPSMVADVDGLPDAVWEAMTSPQRVGSIPLAIEEEAEFSTADAEALGIRGLIGEFTTNHACCQNRVTNIQLMADTVDGAIVMPGETFSLNDHVGQRTTEKGFVCGGALVGGELVEEGQVCIGGGTSQFTTTLHNAVFFAGLEHVRFTPHSAWFDRYPEGREATIGWREPEYIFRNDTENAVVIRTVHEGNTGTTITVKLYGDNGGLAVEAGLSPRRNFTSVRETVRIEPDMNNPNACTPEDAVTIQNGHGGWSVTVYRYITWPDGEQTTEEWHWHYTGLYRIKEYNPDAPACQEDEDEDGNGDDEDD